MAKRITDVDPLRLSFVGDPKSGRKFLIIKGEEEDGMVEKVIKHEGDKWVLYNRDGSKVLGTFETEEDALKRERQIQFFKHQKSELVEKKGNIQAIVNAWGKWAGGEPGTFRKCVATLKGKPGISTPERLCAWLHHRAEGKWPTQKAITECEECTSEFVAKAATVGEDDYEPSNEELEAVWDVLEALVSGMKEEESKAYYDAVDKAVAASAMPDGTEAVANACTCAVCTGKSETPVEGCKCDKCMDMKAKMGKAGEKMPMTRMSKIVAASALRDALESRAADLLELGLPDRAQKLMSLHVNLRSQLPDGGFVVMDSETQVPDGVATYAQFTALGDIESEEDLEAVLASVGKAKHMKPDMHDEDDDEESEAEEDTERPFPGAKAPFKKGKSEAEEEDTAEGTVKSDVAAVSEDVNAEQDVDELAVIDSFAAVIKNALRNKDLGRAEKLAIIQNAFNSLGEAIPTYVEQTTPAGPADLLAQLKTLLAEELAPVKDKIAELDLATRKAVTVVEPREPISKALRPRPSPPQETRKPGAPFKIHEVVERSMQPRSNLY